MGASRERETTAQQPRRAARGSAVGAGVSSPLHREETLAEGSERDNEGPRNQGDGALVSAVTSFVSRSDG